MSNHIGPVVRVVVCAANNYKGHLVCGARHYDSVMCKILKAMDGGFSLEPVQGFIDQFGIFMDRKEALAVATAAGQINVRRVKTQPEHLLFSEDLY